MGTLQEAMRDFCQDRRNKQRLIDWSDKRAALKFNIKGVVPQLFHDGNSHVCVMGAVK